LKYRKIGYRKLTWMMVDAGTVCVGEKREPVLTRAFFTDIYSLAASHGS
jgi:hypothetical protein